jgi:ribosomal peptide maturation radical SAM protein 1
MPLFDPQRPSLALSALKSCLVEAGIETRVQYPNMWFLDYVGLKDYSLLDSTPVFEAVVDWLFAPVAFPGHAGDDKAFVRGLIGRTPHIAKDWPGEEGVEALLARLRAIRGTIPDFIDWVASRTLADGPRIVGCTSTFQQHVASLALLRHIKAKAPGTATVMGGANCESVMGRATHKNFPWVDYVVSGEAEDLVVPLFRLVLEKGVDAEASDVPEAVFAPIHRRTSYPTIAKGDGAPRATVENMARLPVPDFGEYFVELDDSLFRDHIVPALPVETSRGCWWGQKNHCTFCGLNGGGMEFRAKPPQRAIEEIIALSKRYGTRNIETVDNIIDMAYFERVLPTLAALPEKLNLFYETKSNLKRAQVEGLAAAGVRWIQPGIESLSTEILKLMRKGTTAAQNIQLLRLCRQAGVRVSWAIIAGFPGEREESYREMAALMPALTHLQFGSFIYLLLERYSPYHSRAAEYGLTLKPAEPYRTVYPVSDDQLADLVYFFDADGAPRVGRNILDGSRVSIPAIETVREIMAGWRKRWTALPFPTLELHRVGGAHEVVDTRGAETVRHALSALELEILDAADDAPGPDKLLRRAWIHAASPAQAEAALSSLLDRRLALSLDGRIVPLVLRPPFAQIPSISDFPGGYLHAVPVRHGEASRAPAEPLVVA